MFIFAASPVLQCFFIWVSMRCKWRAGGGIQYKCLLPIYVFPEMKLHGLIISKAELKCSVSQFPHSCICDRSLEYKSLTDTWIEELPSTFISGNTKIGFSGTVWSWFSEEPLLRSCYFFFFWISKNYLQYHITSLICFACGPINYICVINI